MKFAISIPDDSFDRAELMARRLNISRSKLYARAVEEFVARHAPDELTEAANRLADQMTDEDHAEVAALTRANARTALQHTEW